MSETKNYNDQLFAEIEIESGNNNSYEPTPIPQSEELVVDEKREIFIAMRDISRSNHSSYFLNTKFYKKQIQYENSKIFYKQAEFMKDFEDDYTNTAPFSSYFPYYQLMSYEQLRTYFTWRTKIRRGSIENTSLSYAFIYIYELLNNIGVNDPIDGLDKLMIFWNTFKVFSATIEKYLIKWIKDYHIYYELPKSFKEFLCENELQSYYPGIANYDPEMSCIFEQLCSISRYNIKQSIFYSDETKHLISDCFDFVIFKLEGIFAKLELEFNNLIFQPSKNKFDWTPFEGALFFPCLKQRNRKVVLSEDEIYTCNQNKWLLSKLITKNSGRQLLTYIFKQMEAVLREVTNYKYKISANPNIINNDILQKLGAVGISLEKIITDAVLEFYKEKNKTVVSVNELVLNKIRLEALDTQEKLIITENDIKKIPIFSNETEALSVEEPHAAKKKEDTLILSANKSSLSDTWISFKNVLNEIEIRALSILLQCDRDIKRFADERGIMLEVLADSINEKAFDHIGDNILELDESMMIYDEYREKTIMILGL